MRLCKLLRIFKNVLFISFLFFTVSSCVINENSTSSISGTAATGSSFSSEKNLYISLTDLKWSTDNSSDISSWEAFTASSVEALSGVNVYLSGSKNVCVDLSSVSSNVALYFTGTLESDSSSVTGVSIVTNKSYEVGLFLTDVTVSSCKMPCFDITKKASISVGLSGTNVLTEGRVFGTDYSSSGSTSKGVLASKGSMTVFEKTEGATLSIVNGKNTSTGYKHCIASNGYLTFESGTYDFDSYTKSAVYGEEAVVVTGGTFDIETQGTVTTSCVKKAHGISVSDDYSDSFIKIEGGSLDINAYNGKGLIAPEIYITGGEIIVVSSGVSNFTNDNNKSGTYVDADGTTVSGSITFAAEGIEGTYLVSISGGTTEVTALDDGINVSDSSGEAKLSGGSLYVYSSGGDGIDCNGNIFISGGVIVSLAPTGSEDAFDCGDSSNYVKFTGGTIAGVQGSSNVSITNSSSQKVYYKGSSSSNMMGGPNQSNSSSSSISYGKNISIFSSSNVVYSFTIPSVSSSSTGNGIGGNSSSTSSTGGIILSSPKLTSSGTVYYGNTVSGGTDFHGLYTTLPTVTKGSTISLSSK